MKNSVKEKIMKAFAKYKLREGNSMNSTNVLHWVLANLNPKEKDSFESAIREMETDGLIEIINSDNPRIGIPSIKLTRLGYINLDY